MSLPLSFATRASNEALAVHLYLSACLFEGGRTFCEDIRFERSDGIFMTESISELLTRALSNDQTCQNFPAVATLMNITASHAVHTLSECNGNPLYQLRPSVKALGSASLKRAQ